MTNSNFWYRSFVIVCGALLIVAHAAFLFNVGTEVLGRRVGPFPYYFLFRYPPEREPAIELTRIPFFNGQFVYVDDVNDSAGNLVSQTVRLVDAETAEVTEITDPQLDGKVPFHVRVWRNRLFVHRFDWKKKREVCFEIAKGQIRQSDELLDNISEEDNDYEVQDQVYFLRVGSLPTIFAQVDGKWIEKGTLTLPTKKLPSGDEGKKSPDDSTTWIWRNPYVESRILSANGTSHLFLGRRDTIVYSMRKPFDTDGALLQLFHFKGTNGLPLHPNDAPWSIVREKPSKQGFGALIKGNPVAVIIDVEKEESRKTFSNVELIKRTETARLYRLRETGWDEFASMELPCGVDAVATFTTGDGQKSYLAGRSIVGESYLYSLSDDGFHPTKGSAAIKLLGEPWENPVLRKFGEHRQVVAEILIGLWCVGAVFAMLIMPWMQRVGRQEYQFGNQSVHLASLARRGAARTIDLLLAMSVIGMADWILRRKVDWIAYAEAIAGQIDDRSLDQVAYNQSELILIAACVFILFVVAQTQWGMTPGKWCLGLRTIQSSFRPCTFAQGLTREVVFFADCGILLCWIPGIMMLGLTERRQRFGDLVADTIVIDSQSLVTKTEQIV